MGINSNNRARTVGRWVISGPLALIAALLAMAASPLFLPKGNAGVDNIVMPIVLFPLYWAATFFYSVLDERVWRAGLVLVGLTGTCGFVVFRAVTGA